MVDVRNYSADWRARHSSAEIAIQFALLLVSNDNLVWQRMPQQYSARDVWRLLHGDPVATSADPPK